MQRLSLAALLLFACRREDRPPPPPEATKAAVEVRHDASPPPPWVELHYAGWSMETLPPSALSLDGVTDVVFFAAVPDGRGVEIVSTKLREENIAALRGRGVRVLLAVGGEKTGARFRGVAAEAIDRLVDRLGLDGVELDIEPLSEISDAKLAEIVRGLSKPQRMLTFAVMPREDEVKRLAPFADVVDRVSLMGYVDRISPVRERELVSALERAGFARHKIGIGIDARTERAERVVTGGILLWEAGALCRDEPRPCAPALVRSRDK